MKVCIKSQFSHFLLILIVPQLLSYFHCGSYISEAQTVIFSILWNICVSGNATVEENK